MGDYQDPTIGHIPLSGISVPDVDQAQLKAWHLTLDANRPSYSFPSDLPEGFFAVPWRGTVIGQPSKPIADRSYQFFQLSPDMELSCDGGETAEIAIIGIVGDQDPSFEPGLFEHSSAYLAFPPTNGNPLEAALIVVDLVRSDGEPAPDVWVRPAFLVTSPGGPRVRLVSKAWSDPRDVVPEDHGDALAIVAVPDHAGLTFRPGRADETIALLVDFYAVGDMDDPGGLVCTWRCPGKG